MGILDIDGLGVRIDKSHRIRAGCVCTTRAGVAEGHIVCGWIETRIEHMSAKVYPFTAILALI